jgi:hypothetical protein
VKGIKNDAGNAGGTNRSDGLRLSKRASHARYKNQTDQDNGRIPFLTVFMDDHSGRMIKGKK